jgi:hypothetical protein
MIQKKTVTSGTLFSICRRVVVGCGVVMGASSRTGSVRNLTAQPVGDVRADGLLTLIALVELGLSGGGLDPQVARLVPSTAPRSVRFAPGPPRCVHRA